MIYNDEKLLLAWLFGLTNKFIVCSFHLAANTIHCQSSKMLLLQSRMDISTSEPFAVFIRSIRIYKKDLSSTLNP